MSNLWIREKESTNFGKKKCGRVGEIKNAAKTRGEIMGFETTSVKSRGIVFHHNGSFKPQELNIKVKN